MKVYKCDICGSYFDEKKIMVFNLVSSLYPVTVDLEFDTKNFDFCEKCLKESVKKEPKIK